MLAECLFALCLLLGDKSLLNGSFEDKPSKQDAIPGWTLELGAQNGAPAPESTVEIDRQENHGGKASLHFSGNPGTRGWRIAKQAIEVRPGGEYRLEVWTKTHAVSANGFGLDNCYVGLFLFDANGELVARQLALPTKPDSEWTKHELSLTAPATVRTAYVYAFLSMLGELWVDDLVLSIQGGERIAAPEVVFREDFTKLARLGDDWQRKVGATNGTGGEDSMVEVDFERGAEGSPRSLHLAGSAATLRWSHLLREFPAKPGELFRWSGPVSAENVRAEGPQFQNLHLNLLFLDAGGEPLGQARFAQLEPGTHDWTALAVEAQAPEGAKRVQAGLFLSMSGDAWFDDLELTRAKGVPLPYSDWPTLEGKGVVLRHSPSHPYASQMKAKLSELEQSKKATCRALEVEFPEKITVFLYKDPDEGRRMTGGSLDFADPPGRRVHQRWDSYIGHEMVHVIAHTTLQNSRTGILGEGIAVWLNGQARNHHADARKLLDESKLPSVLDMLERFGELENGYPAAGSFCGFLIETQGLEVFKALYPLEDPSAKLAELKGASFLDLEPAWHEHLRKF